MKDDYKSAGVVLLALAGACFLALPQARAQTSAEPITPGITESRGAADLYLKSAGRYDRAGDLIGMKVVDRDNKPVGQVSEIITDFNNGRVPLAIVAVSAGNKLMAIPPSLLVPQPGHKILVLNVDRQTLVNPPSFASNAWPDVSNPKWAGSVYSFYGQSAYWQGARPAGGTEIREPSGAYRVPVWISGRDQDQEVDQSFRQYQRGKSSARIMDERAAESAPDLLYPQYPATSSRAGASMRISEASGAQSVPALPARLTRTSDLIGSTVRDSAGQTVGTVRDVVIDWPANRISYAVVTPTGFSDMANQYLAIPPVALTHSPGDPTAWQVNMDKSKLSSAPGFTGTSWPEPSNQAFLANVYSYYGQKPYWTTESGTILGQ